MLASKEDAEDAVAAARARLSDYLRLGAKLQPLFAHWAERDPRFRTASAPTHSAASGVATACRHRRRRHRFPA